MVSQQDDHRLASMFVTCVDGPDVLSERTHLTLVILLPESRNLNQITEKNGREIPI